MFSFVDCSGRNLVLVSCVVDCTVVLVLFLVSVIDCLIVSVVVEGSVVDCSVVLGDLILIVPGSVIFLTVVGTIVLEAEVLDDFVDSFVDCTFF